MIKALIFDLGRVLVNVDYAEGYARMAERSGLAPGEIQRRFEASNLLVPYETGSLTSAEFAARVCDLLGVTMSFEEFGELWYSVFHQGAIVSEELLAALHARYRMVLLSNTSELHFVMLRERLPQLRHFDAYTLSYEVHAHKPAEAIYRDAVAKAGCAAGECFFTDDVEAYVAAARALGLQAQVFQGVEKLKSDLREAGVELLAA